MESDLFVHKILLYFLSAGAIVLNVAMIWSAWFERRMETGLRILLINLGIIDILFAMNMLIRLWFSDDDSDTRF